MPYKRIDNISDYNKQYYENNKERILNYHRFKREKEKEKIKERYKNNKELYKRKSALYYQKNKTKIKEKYNCKTESIPSTFYVLRDNITFEL